MELRPGHLGRPLKVDEEGYAPKGGEGEAHRAHAQQVDQSPSAPVYEQEAPDQEHEHKRGDDMRKDDHKNEQTVDEEEPVELSSSLHALGHGPQKQETKSEAQHVAKLPQEC